MPNGMSDIDRRPMYLQVAERIIDHIKDERMAPGAEIPSEAELCEMAGVSRPVIRSALGYLAGGGIIKISNGRRARVGELDPDFLASSFSYGLATEQITIPKILEVRQDIELSAARLAAERRTDEQAARLEELCEEMEQSICDVDRFVELDFAFHLTIAEATDNSLYDYVIRPMRQTIIESISEGRLSQSAGDDLLRIQDCHRAIAQAIREKDPDAAMAAMTRHFKTALAAMGHAAQAD
ncbi:FadR/GntR family transcriptional regulator [Falsihalocynthiibacter sp. SS001]|uniref:FadR/GntR family transcriptional regulator n=1 Tax=Falsihalocynthiibacter sp. SS001 TaxID=3349698 RepID=UPI0036D299C7